MLMGLVLILSQVLRECPSLRVNSPPRDMLLVLVTVVSASPTVPRPEYTAVGPQRGIDFVSWTAVHFRVFGRSFQFDTLHRRRH